MSAKFAVNQEVYIMNIRCTVIEVMHTHKIGYTYFVYHPTNAWYNAIEWRESRLMSVAEWEQQRWDKREALNQSIKQKLAKLNWRRG